MRRAYRDRARYLGDEDFVKIPAHLTSKEYAKKLAGGIDRERATPSEGLAGDIACETVGEHSLVATDLVRALPEAFRRTRAEAVEKWVKIAG